MASQNSAHTSEEIEQIKQAFPACKVITNVGQFSHVVELKKQGQDIALKFQLEETYPDSVPEVIVKSAQLSTDQKASLAKHLHTEAERLKGEQMLTSLYDAALQWLSEQGVDVTSGSLVVGEKKGNKQHKRKDEKAAGKGKKSGKAKVQEEHVRGSRKLASMKTSEDVVSRILWDENLPSEHFSVGYLDRFVGVVERAFSTFTWEDLASVDYDALAIPKHRIHYFKYRGIKVWDKEQRLDNVFGSTGSGMTITDVIAQFEAGELTSPPPSLESEQSVGQLDSDSDSEDDVVIQTGLEGNEGVMYPRDHYWGPKKRPTHFLCLRVTAPEIVAAVEEADQRIVGVEPLYEENVMPAGRLHITLACLGLDTLEDVDQATQRLHAISPELTELEPTKIRVKLQDVDNFFNNVLYARVEYNPDFLAFVHRLKILIQEAGIEIRDVFEFTPHMTLLKLKRDVQKELRTRYIEPEVYASLKGVTFGEQVLDNIYLCEMSENRDQLGFYICPTHIKF